MSMTTGIQTKVCANLKITLAKNGPLTIQKETVHQCLGILSRGVNNERNLNDIDFYHKSNCNSGHNCSWNCFGNYLCHCLSSHLRRCVFNMSVVGAALIGGASSLLGGLFGKSSAKKATSRQNEYNKPINIRKRAEEGGFNPLLWAGTGNIQNQPTASGMMGNAIANAGLYAADSMKDKEALDIEKASLAMDRERLDELLQQNTIRPKKGGIYSGMAKTPRNGGVGSLAPLASSSPSIITETAVAANVEQPRELEGDAYGALIRGGFFNYVGDLFNKNVMSDGDERNRQRDIERSPLAERWRIDELNRRKKPRSFPFKPSGSPKGNEIFGSRNNKM